MKNVTVVNVPLQMQQQPGQFRVSFRDKDGKVAGLFFLKTGVTGSREPARTRTGGGAATPTPAECAGGFEHEAFTVTAPEDVTGAARPK